MVLDNEPGEGMSFASMSEIKHALYNEVITIHSKTKFRRDVLIIEGEVVPIIVDTSFGWLIIGELLPRNHNVGFKFVNKSMTEKGYICGY